MKFEEMTLMLKRTIALNLFLLLPVPALASDAASILVFPLFDISEDFETLVSVTNTNVNDVMCGNGFEDGEVVVEYAYVDGVTREVARVSEHLTPGDTLSVLVSRHLRSSAASGFLVVSAMDAASGTLLRFDHLVGKAVLVTGGGNRAWAYSAYPIASASVEEPMECIRESTDVDGEGDADLDGIEYSRSLDTLLLPVFIEEGIVSNRLVLLSLASGTTDYEVHLWNNDETLFVRRPSLSSWWSGSLSDITQIAESLQGDSSELPKVEETGWMSLTASEEQTGLAVPLFGVFVQTVDGTGYAEGIVLPKIGTEVVPGFSFP